MPPKPASKKTEDKKKQKVVEDKTFGLKNKNKSKTVQKYIKTVSVQVTGKGGPKDTFEAKKKKEEEREKLLLEQTLLKPVIEQKKVPIGVDPKSILCEFFKKGACNKGDKCKYSHNLEIERKSERLDIYVDRREIGKMEQEVEEKFLKENDTIDKWDQNKLELVVTSKHATENTPTKTKIVCKYFLEAIEAKKYGWFWDCPNGGDKCQYQHCLPPGFVLKVSKKEVDEEDIIPIEELIEEERAKLVTRTPLTLELFLKWREDKKKRKEESDQANKEKREQDIKSGKTMRSGREMFDFNPDLFIDEEDVFDTEELEPEEQDDNEPIINLELTGTSIRTRIENGKEEEEEHKVQEDLFNEEDLPEEEEEEEK